MTFDNLPKYWECNPPTPVFELSNTMVWARIDKDNNVTHLDMDLCAKGAANLYTALAVAIWNAAIDAAAKACIEHQYELVSGHSYSAEILRLKK